MSVPHGDPFAPTLRTLRQFAALWVVFFGAIAFRQEFQHQHHLTAALLAVIALTVGPVGLVLPRAIRPVFVTWMKLASPIGWVVSRIVLGIIFYGLFTPVSWICRVTGRDALHLKPQPQAGTYWCPKPGPAEQVQYLRQF